VISQQGSHGHDTINLGTGYAVIYEQGVAIVHGAFGALDFYGGELEVKQIHGVTVDIALSGHATLIGGTADPEFVGAPGTTYMKGGASNDTCVGGSGHATMVGGTGHDLFKFITGETGGQDIIKNFVAGHDQLYVEGYSLSYLQQHHDISTHGDNTYISLDGGKTTIELQGVTTLKASDFSTHKP
jgi:Ca2+-binding RTX toxin-like protein